MRFLCLFIALGTSVFSGSVYAATTDTLDINENLSMIQKVQRTSAYQITKQGVPLLFASALATTIDKRIQETRQANMSSFSYHFDDYLQYAPMAAMFGMKLAGVKGRSNWGEMMTADVFSAALMAGVVNGLKYTVKRDRPNHSKNNSFPSGHTATAFMAATMLYKEYKDLSPWVGIGAYSAATLVAAGRMMNNRHWLSDVLAGAGIGIMSTEVGYILSDLIFRKKPVFDLLDDDISYSRIPSFIEYSIGYSSLFPRKISLNGKELTSYQGLNTTISAAYYRQNGWGINLQATIQSAKLTQGEGIVGATSFSIGPGYTYRVIPRIFLNSKLEVGYCQLLYNQDVLHKGISGTAATSLLAQISPAMGFRLYLEYVYTSLPYFETNKRLNYLNTGLAISALF